MNKHYDVSQQTLDLQRKCMAATLKIIEKITVTLTPSHKKLLSLNSINNKLYRLHGLSDIIQMVPTVKILKLSKNEVGRRRELDKGKRLQREDMSANRSPLCTTFPDKSTNIRSVILSVTLWDSELCLTVPAWRGQHPCSSARNRGPILSSLFPHRYYLIYDSGDRQGLLSAYHDEACFSLTIPFNPKEPAPSSLCEYLKESRNMKKVQDPYLRVQLLKHTKHDIVHSLCVLPQTQHDLSSFVVDIWFQMDLMLCFSVNGVFKEVEGMSQDSVRAFTRTFIANPVNNYSLCIMNDTLLVNIISPKNTMSTFSIPVPTPSCSYSKTFSQKQQGMVQSFTTQSGMNLQREQKLGGLVMRLRVPGSADLPTPLPHFLQVKHKIPEEVIIQTDPGS
uniref:NTF2 domain-containing protein n=1 Tax=Lynx canadensis TaxID=61383 RepID=A0A667HT76_LYNCA